MATATFLVRSETEAPGEAPFRLLADHLPALCFMADADGRLLWCNRRWYDFTGVDPDIDLGRAWVEAQQPDGRGEFERRWSAAIAAGRSAEIEVALRNRDGQFQPLLTTAEPVRDKDGAISCWFGTMTEIAGQHEAERNRRFLVELGDVIAHESQPQQILLVAGRALAGHLRVTGVGYVEVADSGATVAAGGWADAEESVADAGTLNLDDFGKAVLDRLRAGKICDLANLPDGETKAIRRRLGLRAALVVPLIKDGRLAALLYAHDAAPRDWREAEIQLARDVAERVWSTLERARSEAALRASEERLRLTLEGVLLGTIEWDLVTERGQWSRRTSEIFGVDWGDDITPRCVLELIHPDDRGRVASTAREAVADAQQYVVEFRIRRPHGELRWVVLRARIQRDAQGEAVAAFGLVLDITDRKDAEERLRESEARLRAIVEATPECVKIVGENGRLLFMNPAGLRLIEADAVGDFSVPDLVAPECREEWLANHARVCAGENVSWEFDVISLAGARRRMETHAVPLRLADGSAQHLAVTRDVTERRRAEERLRQSENLLAAFMKNAPVGMYLKDGDGRYLMLNPEMSKVFGRPAEELIGRSAAELLGPQEAAMIAAFDREILETGRSRSVEEYLPGIDSYSWSLVVRFPIAGADDQPVRIGGFDIDITDKKLAEEALAHSRDALHQSEKLNALGSLLAGVSHELNNPLAIVVTLSTLLEEEAEGTAMGERAGKIRKAGERCARIVQTFLAMARQRPPERRRVEANDVVRGALELAGYSLGSADIEIVHDLAPDLPPLQADADQLHQMVLNLVVNAQQALQQRSGGRRLTVSTAAADRGRAVSIKVADNGPGVPPEVRRRIFEPFFTTKAVGEGTGLGLSFSLGIVEAHGGSLDVAETPGGGACFTATLPAEPSSGPIPEPADAARGGRSARILVIDDDRDVAEALAELLTREGLCVETAASGREAQKLIAQRHYDMVLSDLRMPDIDGLLLFDWLKRVRPSLAERTGFVTGDTMSPDAARVSIATGRPLLEKPFAPEDVRRLLDQLIPGEFGAGRQQAE